MAHETVLVIEDEPAIRDLLRLHLGLAGFTVKEAADGRVGLTLGRAERFDVVILDVMLTGRDSESDKVVGLESGADDYGAKPFGMRELLARVQALLRRHRRGSSGVTAAAAPRITSRALSLDLDKRQATVR